jgi:catechol 2,3-dioxygenase
VELRVRSATEVAAFYRRVIGLTVDRTDEGASLSAGGGEPLLILRETPDAPDRHPDAAGLYHVAFRVPDRGALGAAVRRIRAASHPIDGRADHTASEAIYLTDPEGNGIEIYADRPRTEWEYTDDGQVRLRGDPLDLETITARTPTDFDPDGSIHPETDIGHVHLEVTDLERSTPFYRDAVGFGLRRRKPRSVFLAGGEYHHHLALNTRYGRTQPYSQAALGVASIEITVPPAAFGEVRNRFRDRDIEATDRGEEVSVVDPDGIPFVVTTRDRS